MRTRAVTVAHISDRVPSTTFSHTFAMSSTDALNCGSGGGDDSSLHLRIASVFIILVGSMSGALFPVLARRSTWLRVPKFIFEFVLSRPSYAWYFFYSYCTTRHTASPNTSVQESLYGQRPFRVGNLFDVVFFFEDRYSVYPSSRIWNI
jgi:hypothetical protein